MDQTSKVVNYFRSEVIDGVLIKTIKIATNYIQSIIKPFWAFFIGCI